MPFLVTLWMLVAAIGGGLFILKASGLLGVLTLPERLSIGSVLGIGLIGWLAFFAGLAEVYAAPAFIGILLALSFGWMFFRSPSTGAAARLDRASPLEWLLIAGLLAVAAMDIMEALAPAADADSLAYHFETPRLFLAEHRIFAIPRAIDGVTQLLVQLSYGIAEGLGGKQAVPLWTLISGWSTGALLYVLARRHVARAWALAGTLILMTAPAVVYAAGTGQVEVRAAAFALLAAYGAAMAVQGAGTTRISLSWVIVAGLAAGFFVGTKMTGLIFATATGLILISMQASVLRVVLYALAVLLAGSQWYIYNWTQTGDPIYPLLWQHVTLMPGFEWDAGMAERLSRMWRHPDAIPRSLFWYVAYPLRTIIAPLPEFGAGRIGFGPAAVILAPFAIIAAFQVTAAYRSTLFKVMLCGIFFYTIWFFTTPTLLVRLILPAYPLVILCVICGTSRFTDGLTSARSVVWSGVAFLLLIQISGQVLFTKKFADYLFSGQSKTAYLKNNIARYGAVIWLNSHLTNNDRALVTHREWLYLLDVPHFMAHPDLQTQVRLTPDANNNQVFSRQLEKAGITHVVVQDFKPGSSDHSLLLDHMRRLEQAGCAHPVAELDLPIFASRTLPQLQSGTQTILVFTVKPETCYPG
ncbi:glycosyltransferase family 39 protein [Thalassospiraceae bacterium LMO-JJ14]|nr:glycosyltransferase family 39 protein [Thalassospiraceae bacterium LMO-JJ14]